MVGQASARVPQLPHAERVAEERVSAPNNHPEFRQGEGERTRHNCNKKKNVETSVAASHNQFI